jgi:hypothetical protein
LRYPGGLLPAADGPLVKVTLHDGQTVFAVLRARRREADSMWWVDLRIHLPGPSQVGGMMRAEPFPVDFRAPAELCEPIDGQDYSAVPTVRHGVTPAWTVERPLRLGDDSGSVWVVHRGGRGSCPAAATVVTSGQARAVLRREDGAPCPVCRPDRPLGLEAGRG